MILIDVPVRAFKTPYEKDFHENMPFMLFVRSRFHKRNQAQVEYSSLLSRIFKLVK